MHNELIKRLRECTAEMNGEKTLWHQAADAIEELQKDLERSNDFEAFWQHEAEEALKKFQVAISNKPRWRVGTDTTNGDSIRSMTDEELAEFMFRTFGRPAWCLDNNCPPEESCVQCWLEWLKQESENLNEQTN